MKILLVTSHYSPEPLIGAVRPTQSARFLAEQGHDVAVLTKGGPWGEDCDGLDVVRTPWIRLPLFRYTRHHAEGRPNLDRAGRDTASGGRTPWRKWIARVAHELFSVPDVEGGWIPFGYSAGRRLISRFKADVIFASGPSFAGHIIAASLASKHRIPWVADYRDLWTVGGYYAFTSWRRRLEVRLERATLANAAAATAISRIMAAELQDNFALPSVVVRNGADPVDPRPLEERVPLSSARVNLLYVGNNFYEGRRTPRLLFRAASDMGLSAAEVRFHFLGSDPNLVLPVAVSEGVADLVSIHGAVDHAKSLEFQSRADALVLLLWDDEREAATLPAKLFEYAAVRRPVVLVGYTGGEAAELVIDNGLGWLVDDVSKSAEVLKGLLQAKHSPALMADLPEATALSRGSQLRTLEQVLKAVVEDSDRGQSVFRMRGRSK